jgi:hypothetical protein
MCLASNLRYYTQEIMQQLKIENQDNDNHYHPLCGLFVPV